MSGESMVEGNRAVQIRESDKPEERLPQNSSDLDISVRERNDALKSITAACEKGDIDFLENDSESISPLAVARLMLLSKTLFGRRCADECLTIHEMNLFYRFRSQISPGGWETKLIWRSLLKDDNDLVPGWYWFKSDEPKTVDIYLWLTAMRDNDPSIRAHCIDLLTRVHSRPDANVFNKNVLAAISSDDSPEVQKAALEYFVQNGISEDLGHVKDILETGKAGLTDIGRRAEWSIKSRTNLKDAFAELLSMESVPAGTMTIFTPCEDQIPTELLDRGLAHGDSGIRSFATRILMERRVLSKEVAFTLLSQDSQKIKALAYTYLISLGERYSPAEIRQSLEEKDTSEGQLRLLSSLLAGIDTDAILHSLLEQYSYADLLKEIEWYSEAGTIAYEVMAKRFFAESSERIRKDLDEGFETLHNQYFENRIPILEKNLRKSLQTLPVSVQDLAIKTAAEELRKDENEGTREYIRGKYIAAALLGLAQNCEEKDLLIARRYLTESQPEYYGEVEVNAARIIAKLGDSSDVALLASRAQQMNGKKKQILLEAALKLSPGIKGIASQLLQDDSLDAFELGIRSLIKAGDSETNSILEKNLLDENESKRQKALSLIVENSTDEDLRQLLERYISRDTYYYNVVCWLDRYLFAPDPIRQVYAKQIHN